MYHSSFFYTKWCIILFLREHYALTQDDSITETSIQKQTQKTKKGLGSYLRYVSSHDCIFKKKIFTVLKSSDVFDISLREKYLA